MALGERIRRAIIRWMQKHDSNPAATRLIWANQVAAKEWEQERKRQAREKRNDV